MILTRRNLFGLLAAPAIIRVADLMPVKAWAEPGPYAKLVTFEIFQPDPWRFVTAGRFAHRVIVQNEGSISIHVGDTGQVVRPGEMLEWDGDIFTRSLANEPRA